MKKEKILNIINIIICIVIGIFLFLELFIWIVTFFKDNSTINIFGYKPYIAEYDEEFLNFEQGDLVFAKELEHAEDYIYNSEIIYKQHYKNNGQAVILRSENYNIVENNSENRVEGVLNFVIKKVGKVILFFREIYIVILVVILVLLIATIVYIKRTKNGKINTNDKINKTYIRIRRAKDISIILFIVVTYISIFLIGKLNKNVGKEAIILDNNTGIDNNIEVNNMQEHNNVQIENSNFVDTTNNISNSISNSGNNNTNNNEYNNINNNVNQNTGIVFTVTENNKSWNQVKNLSIFNNNYFNGENKIAPGISGTYEFKIENKSEYNMKYTISFEEQNEYGINLKYKIKRNGEYINESYQSIEELNLNENIIDFFETDIYTIEWKWIENDNDTQIGENAENVKYNLRITVYCEQQ